MINCKLVFISRFFFPDILINPTGSPIGTNWCVKTKTKFQREFSRLVDQFSWTFIYQLPYFFDCMLQWWEVFIVWKTKNEAKIKRKNNVHLGKFWFILKLNIWKTENKQKLLFFCILFGLINHWVSLMSLLYPVQSTSVCKFLCIRTYIFFFHLILFTLFNLTIYNRCWGIHWFFVIRTKQNQKRDEIERRMIPFFSVSVFEMPFECQLIPIERSRIYCALLSNFIMYRA